MSNNKLQQLPFAEKMLGHYQKGQDTFPSCSSCFPLPPRAAGSLVLISVYDSASLLQSSILSDGCFVFLQRTLQRVLPLQCEFGLVLLR